jgi:FkbM family methyltransferase
LIKKIFRLIYKLHQQYFVGVTFYRVNNLLFELGMRGLGIGNFENDRVSGEEHLFHKLLAGPDDLLVIDVGANEGDYSSTLLECCPNAKVYAIEPHPQTFKLLEAKAARNNFKAFNMGFSDIAGTMQLFDRVAEGGGTQHASLYRGVIEDLHKVEAESVEVQICTLDSFVVSQGISHINLLKIDTEGNELKVLLGATQILARNLVDIIQIEFNEMNTISRVFFKDFFELLKGYDCYRLLPDGLLPIPQYRPSSCELFAFQNILFVRKGYRFNTVKKG